MAIKKSTFQKINGFLVCTRYESQDGLSVIYGNVYPFADKFHSVGFESRSEEFSLLSEEKEEIVQDYSISFGGNEHSGKKGLLVVSAGQIAANLAIQNSELLETLSSPNSALSLMEDMISMGNYDELSRAVFLCQVFDRELVRQHKGKTTLEGLISSRNFSNMITDIDLDNQDMVDVLYMIAIKSGKPLHKNEDEMPEADRRNELLNVVKGIIVDYVKSKD